MSLKALHIVFIVASIVLAIGFGAWSFNEFSNGAGRNHLWTGVASVAAGLGLIVYGRAVLRKLRHISYL
jgi:hypothetical protein